MNVGLGGDRHPLLLMMNNISEASLNLNEREHVSKCTAVLFGVAVVRLSRYSNDCGTSSTNVCTRDLQQ